MVDPLSAEQHAQLKEAFDLIDEDKDGVLNVKDLQRFLLGFSQEFSKDDINSWLNDVTVKKTVTGVVTNSLIRQGFLDFPEFLNTVSRLVAESAELETSDECLISCFEVAKSLCISNFSNWITKERDTLPLTTFDEPWSCWVSRGRIMTSTTLLLSNCAAE